VPGLGIAVAAGAHTGNREIQISTCSAHYARMRCYLQFVGIAQVLLLPAMQHFDFPDGNRGVILSGKVEGRVE